MKMKPPQLLVDVFRDLRDRRLLIPAAALLVALVAVPALLSQSSGPAPTELAPAGEVALESAATEPAVLAETVTVRDYKDRLHELKSKNPFSEQFAVPGPTGGKLVGDPVDSGGGDSVATGGSPLGSGSLDTSSSTSDISSATSTSSAPASSPSSSGSNGSSGPGGNGGGDNAEPPPITRFVTHRIDVLVGPAGDAKAQDNVKQLRLLPSNSKPVVAFLGASENGDQAVFLVSDDVAAVNGGGHCFPNGGNCQYLTMKEGDDATFDYTPDSKTYRLKLKRIRDVELKDAPGVSLP